MDSLQIRQVLKLIPLNQMATIAQSAYDSWNWYGGVEYKMLFEEATVLAKQWDESFELKHQPVQ